MFRSTATGSSPRLRGTASLHGRARRGRRFIPAPAGNRGPWCRSSRRGPVHPRACGEQARRAIIEATWVGSSPRLRGTGHTGDQRGAFERFIPAPAGNRPARRHKTSGATVHPRACGEQMPDSVCRTSVNGSSPRLRGTVFLSVGRYRDTRFIPAPAGNSDEARSFFLRNPVHPRACGEQRSARRTPNHETGSSPRLRGTELEHGSRADRLRFIPAPAGNSVSRSHRYLEASVHPRACGEQHYLDNPLNWADGSSPRLRGTGHANFARATSQRFIPAPAGNRE